MINIYSKKICPYCVKAKLLFESLEIPFKVIDITETPEMMDDLEKKSGIRTVPQIFVDDKFIGDFSTVNTLNDNGQLIDLLK